MKKENKIKKLLVFLTVFLIILSQFSMAYSLFDFFDTKEKAGNVVVPGWYGLEDWELQECSVWGGTEEAQIGARTSAPIYVSQTTLTLQGQKSLMPDNTTFYEISWYFHPNAEAVNFNISMSTDDGTVKAVASNTANPASGAEGYYYTYINETEGNYTYVKMDYVSNWIEVPIIQIE